MRADALRNRLAIIDTARRLFAEHGTSASLDEIATLAGVGSGTLYRRFADRDDLIAACVEREAADMLESGAELLLSPDSYDALREWLLSLLSLASSYDGLSTAVMSAASRPESALALAYLRIADVTSRLLERAQAERRIRPDLTTNELGSLVLAIAAAIAQDRDRRPQGPRMIALLFEGFDA